MGLEVQEPGNEQPLQGLKQGADVLGFMSRLENVLQL